MGFISEGSKLMWMCGSPSKHQPFSRVIFSNPLVWVSKIGSLSPGIASLVGKAGTDEVKYHQKMKMRRELKKKTLVFSLNVRLIDIDIFYLCITKLYIPYHFGHLKINPLFSCFNWWFYSGVTESFISMRGQMSACLLCLQQEAELVRLALEMSLQEETMQNVAWGRKMVPCLKLA